jgi:antitoxin (DNA-binding transcriptional repressor) of toxin-antitoxin stability system
MKTMNMDKTTFASCVKAAQKDRVIVTQSGHAVALVIGIEDMDAEQLELSKSKKFWQLVAKWRKQPRYSQEEVDRILELDDQPAKAPKKRKPTKAKKAVVK